MPPPYFQDGILHTLEIHRILASGYRGCRLDNGPEHYRHSVADAPEDATGVIGLRFYPAVADVIFLVGVVFFLLSITRKLSLPFN